MDKLYNLISECRYGIHDLSGTELDPEHGLPRFNMPLELGIFLGAKRYGATPQLKRVLILDVDRSLKPRNRDVVIVTVDGER